MTTTLLGGPGHGKRVDVPASLGGYLRWPNPAPVGPVTDLDPMQFPSPSETLYERQRYAFPFRPPQNFEPTLVEDKYRLTAYSGYRERWWTIWLWGTKDAHEEIRREIERLNAAMERAGGVALFGDPLGAFRALPSEVRYFFARRRVLWRWLRGESLDDLPFVLISANDVPSWGTK